MKSIIIAVGSFMFGFIIGALMSANKKYDNFDDVEYIPDDDFWNDFDKGNDR